MKLLVTGTKGLIGSEYARQAEENGHEVTRCDIKDDDYDETFFPQWAEYLDGVIHFGARSSTVDKDIPAILDNNLESSKGIAIDCALNDILFQYASSASVYGHVEEGHKSAETDMPAPLNPYAWSKYLLDRDMEHGCYNSLGLYDLGFRYFNVYGKNEGHKGNQASPIYRFIKQAKEDGVIKLFEGSENFKRDFISVEDVVAIQLKFLTNNAPRGIYNIGTGEAVSFARVAELVAAHTGADIQIIPMPDHLKCQYQKWTCSDNTKLLSVIGDYKFATVEESIAKLVNSGI